VPVCPVDCIHPTPDEPGFGTTEMLYIDAQSCVDCGACLDACPVDAIVPDVELVGDDVRYLEINALHFGDHTYLRRPAALPAKAVPAIAGGPLRVAMVGAGPSACYAAEELLGRRGLDVRVNMFERLPVPWGLARYGVAPDHPGTKAVTELFEKTAGRRDLTFHLNVEVGQHVTNDELLASHHAVVYAVGAPLDRHLGIPGEHLAGSCSATDFVAWYNGHPEYADHSFDLTHERVVVIGNGNVALDVARVLVSDVDSLRRTDIADHALAALAASKVREVVVLGRRGPAQAAYTTPELLALRFTNGVDIVVDPDESALDADTVEYLDANPDSTAELKSRIVAEYSRRDGSASERRIVLRYLASPVEILGTNQVEGLRIVRNRLTLQTDGRLSAEATGRFEDIECGQVLRSIGYQGRPTPGVPFDPLEGTIPNVMGRVIDSETGSPIRGLYTAGWIKRGPSGVIGTNKKCAQDTVSALIDDYVEGRLVDPPNGQEYLQELISERQPNVFGIAGWNAIDEHERSRASGTDRPRVKTVDKAELIRQGQGGR
jgi:ferredoxin--NADP+ reductase